jgi:hypothetical protein
LCSWPGQFVVLGWAMVRVLTLFLAVDVEA